MTDQERRLEAIRQAVTARLDQLTTDPAALEAFLAKAEEPIEHVFCQVCGEPKRGTTRGNRSVCPNCADEAIRRFDAGATDAEMDAFLGGYRATLDGAA